MVIPYVVTVFGDCAEVLTLVVRVLEGETDVLGVDILNLIGSVMACSQTET